MRYCALGVLAVCLAPSVGTAQSLDAKLLAYTFEHTCLEFLAGNRINALSNLSKNFSFTYKDRAIEFPDHGTSGRAFYVDLNNEEIESDTEGSYSNFSGAIVVPGKRQQELLDSLIYANDLVSIDMIDRSRPLCQFGSDDLFRAWGDDVEAFNERNSQFLEKAIRGAIERTFPDSDIQTNEYGNVTGFGTPDGPMRISFGGEENYVSMLVYPPKE